MKSVTQILNLVADYYSLMPAEIVSPGRKEPLNTIRRVICQLCWDNGFKDADIAIPLNRERSTIHVMRHRFNPDRHPALRADWDWLSGKSKTKPSTTWLKARVIYCVMNKCECGTIYEAHSAFERNTGCPGCRALQSDLDYRRLLRVHRSPQRDSNDAHVGEYAYAGHI